MSWLARSFANSLGLDDYNDDGDDDRLDNDVASYSPHDPSPSNRNEQVSTTQSYREIEEHKEEDDDYDEEAHARGVKEDLTELKETLTRQLWDVASFLAPPPPPPPTSTFNDRSFSNLSDQSDPSDRSAYDLEEISFGGRFRSEVTEISKMTSNYFPFESEETENEKEHNVEDAIGITDEVLAFARNIAMHPETWLDFPLDEDDDDIDVDGFDMSDAQREHTLAIEQLAPRLAALRIELCPCHMTEGYFWKVYFVLLHSRLNKHDAEILSTPQVVEARTMWMKELHKQTKQENDWYGKSNYETDRGNALYEAFVHAGTSDFEPTTSRAIDYETGKHQVSSTDMQFVDKFVIKEKPVIQLEENDILAGRLLKVTVPDYEDDDDDWPDVEDSDLGSCKANIHVGSEEDFSFSDLEDAVSSTIPVKTKILPKAGETSASDKGNYKATIPVENEEDFSFHDLEDDLNSTIPIRRKLLSETAETSTS